MSVIKTNEDFYDFLGGRITYCIMNKRTGLLVYGTDYRYSPPHQRTGLHQALTFPDRRKAELAFEERCCGKDYKIVKVKMNIIESEE